MQWTTKKPTEEGWYWVKTGTYPRIENVFNYFGELNMNNKPINIFKNVLWAGPIPEPSEDEND